MISSERPSLEEVIPDSKKGENRGGTKNTKRKRFQSRKEIDVTLLKFMNKWRLDLARTIISDTSIGLHETKRIVQRILNRLIMIKYAEDHLTCESPNLELVYESWLQTKPQASLPASLETLFKKFGIYGRLERDDLDVLEQVDDEVVGRIIGQLCSITFRNVTADILGNTYESYLSNNLVMKKGNLNLEPDYKTKKGQGIYYTPVPVVEYITEKTVKKLLDAHSEEISHFRVVDPACGSGLFLMKALDFLKEYYENKNIKEALCEKIIRENLYGVDADEQAAEIASSNLALKALNLKEPFYENIKVGDSLLSWLDIDDVHEYAAQLTQLITIRHSARTEKKRDKKEEWEKKERKIREELNSLHNKKLLDTYFNQCKINFLPFNWQIEFPEVFDPGKPKEERGFDVAIGNPPWVSFGLRDAGKLPEELKRYYNDRINAAEYKISLYALFMERGISLLHAQGVFGFIVPDSFLLGRYFSKLRRYILDMTKIREIVLILEDFWAHGTAGRSVIIILEREENERVRRGNTMVIQCCETLEDLEKRNFKTYQYAQEYFETTSHNRFRLFFDKESKAFVDMVEAGSPLSHFVDLYSGCIGRYGQKSIVSDKKREEFVIKDKGIIYEDKQAFNKWRPVLESGSDIDRYTLVYKGKYVYVEPDEGKRRIYAKSGFDEKKYTGKKLLLRQTGDSLTAAYDEGQHFCLNNMHVVNLLENVKNYDIKYILAVLNSKLMNYYYHAVSLERGRVLAQTDIEAVKELPIKPIDFENKKEKYLHDQIVEKTNVMLLLNDQRVYILSLFRELIRKFRQDTGLRPFAGYYTRRSLNFKNEESDSEISEYKIDYLKSEELIDYKEEGVVTSVKVREEENFVVISVLLQEKLKYKDIIRVKFTDDLFKHFFSLALETFLTENASKRKWSKKRIFEVMDSVYIPYHVTLRSEDARNIKELMKTLKNSYEKAVKKEFSQSPVKEFDLTKIYKKITETDREIDNFIYQLYNLDDEKIKSIEKY